LKKNLFVISAFALCAVFGANAQSAVPTKIGIIHVQAAILQTKDGQKAAADVNAKFAPRQADLEKKKASIDAMEESLRKQSATMNDDARAKLTRDIDNGKKSLTRESEDAQSDLEQEEGKVFNELGSKLYAIVDKFAKDNGFAVIIDVSPQTQPVFWAADAVNITNEVVALYDKANPGGGTTSTTAPAPRPAAPAGVAPRQTAPPSGVPPAAPKKQ